MNHSCCNDVPKRFRILDIGCIACILIIGISLFPLYSGAGIKIVAVYKNNTLIAEYPLSENRRFTVDGAIGPMLIRINKTAVRVEHATCPKQLCVKTGAISLPYQQIICAPNKIIIEIQLKDGERDFDAISY
jgi:hypothetical protein